MNLNIKPDRGLSEYLHLGKNKPQRALVLMTALLPTIGHKLLVEYASSLMMSINMNGTVELLISGRTFEPISTDDRYMAFRQEFDKYIQAGLLRVTYFEKDDMPQNPEDHENFWDIWKNAIEKYAEIKPGDIVVASEPYGHKLAETLGCTFYPYDLNRQIYEVKGTNVRDNIVYGFDKIMPSIRKRFKTTATIFGAESCGKTTTGLIVSDLVNGYFLPEWARPYLESLGSPNVTSEHMEMITNGQSALQKHARLYLNDRPFIVQDTDLLSTIGYYHIMGLEIPQRLVTLFKIHKSEIYYLMTSDIPFVPDPLRYGGDKRESTDEFWIDLLKMYDCNYVVVEGGGKVDRAMTIKNHLYAFAQEKFETISEFVRD